MSVTSLLRLFVFFVFFFQNIGNIEKKLVWVTVLAFQFCWTCDQNIPNQLLSIMNKVFANMYIVEFEKYPVAWLCFGLYPRGHTVKTDKAVAKGWKKSPVREKDQNRV